MVLLLVPTDANVLAQFENMRDTLVNMLCAVTDCMNFKCRNHRNSLDFGFPLSQAMLVCFVCAGNVTRARVGVSDPALPSWL